MRAHLRSTHGSIRAPRAALASRGCDCSTRLPPYESAADVVRTVADLRRPGTPLGSSPRCSASPSCGRRRARSSARSPTGCSSPRPGSSRQRGSRSPRSTPAASSARAQVDRRPRLRHRRGCPRHRRARARGHRGRARRGDGRHRGLQPRAVVERPGRARHCRRRRPRRRRRRLPRSRAPLRRQAPHRSRRTGRPSLDFAFGLAERLPTGVKLAPGIDRDLIPADAEAQWVSVDHDVVEVGLWFGALARPGIRRAALVVNTAAGGASELTAEADSEDAAVRPLGAVPLRTRRRRHPRPSHRRPRAEPRCRDARPDDRLPHRRRAGRRRRSRAASA